MTPRYAPLGDVAPASPAKVDFPPDAEVWHLTLDQVESDTGRILEERHAPARTASSSTVKFDEGNVLYSKLRPYLNKVVRPHRPGIATSEMVPLRPDPAVMLPEFLAFYLRSPRFVEFATSTVAGAKMPRVIMSAVWEHQVPVPSLDEQQRVVNRLRRADLIQAEQREATKLGERMLPAAFERFFGTSLDQYGSALLGDAADVVSGVTKGRSLVGKTVRDVPYLRVANVQAGYIDLAEVKAIPATQDEIEALRLLPGDVVMTEGGDFDKLGRGALWDVDLADCIHQNHVFRVRLDRQRLLPTYFAGFLQTDTARRYFLSCAKRTTNLASINMTQLRRLPVPLPPISKQAAFDEFVRAFRRLEAEQMEARNQGTRLMQALYRTTFG